MGKRIAILLMLLAAAVLLPFTAVLADEFDIVPVTSDGVTQKLHWDKLNIRNGKMVVTVMGFNEVKGTWKLQRTELLLEARAVYRDGEGYGTA